MLTLNPQFSTRTYYGSLSQRLRLVALILMLTHNGLDIGGLLMEVSPP